MEDLAKAVSASTLYYSTKHSPGSMFRQNVRILTDSATISGKLLPECDLHFIAMEIRYHSRAAPHICRLGVTWDIQLTALSSFAIMIAPGSWKLFTLG